MNWLVVIIPLLFSTHFLLLYLVKSFVNALNKLALFPSVCYRYYPSKHHGPRLFSLPGDVLKIDGRDSERRPE